MSRSTLTAAWIVVTSVACQSAPKAGEPKAAPTDAPAPKAEPTQAPAAVPSAAQPYTVRIVPGAAAAGKAATSVIEVSPAAGYHVNQDFPSRLRVTPPTGVTVPRPDLGKDDAELSESLLRFSVAFTATSPGKVTLAGLSDFSVCNDTTCKLIRDEKLSWDVEVKP